MNIQIYTNDLAETYLQTSEFAFDIESDTYNYHWSSGERGLSYVADITHISFYSPSLPAMVLTAQHRDIEYSYEHFNIETEEFEQRVGIRHEFFFSNEEIHFLRRMFGRDGYTAIAHNLIFDARQIFGKFNIPVPQGSYFWDTLAIHVFGAWGADLNDNEEEDDFESTEKVKSSFTLFNLTSQWLTEEEKQWWASFKGERGNLTRLLFDERRRNRLGITDEEINRYVAVDSIMAFQLYQWQKAQIDKNGFDAVLDLERKVEMQSMSELLKIDLEYTRLCLEMSVEGMTVDLSRLKSELVHYTKLWKKSLITLGLTLETEAQFRKAAWKQKYIFSKITPPDDPQTIFIERLKTPKGAWSFNKVALRYYMDSYPELIYFRHHADLETKIKRINEFIRHSEHDGKVHTIFARHTVTGRNSSNQPNLQNLAMKNKDHYPENSPVEKPGLDSGYFYAGDPDYVFISLDCSNAENWMAAMYAMDDDMAHACAQADFHTVMASTAYFADFWNAITPKEQKEWRNKGKTITFGTAYGMGKRKLAYSLRIPESKAQEFLDNRDRKFWRVKQAKDRSSAFAAQNGYTILWSGRRVAIRKWNGQYKGYTAWNSLAQGGVGEMIVRGMLSLKNFFSERNYKSKVVGQVHDEIIIKLYISEYRQVIIPIIELLSTVISDVWNSRTTPPCRWLFTLDNIDNATKWGLESYRNYPLPITEYVNRWGFQLYKSDEKEAPNWINQWGYGEEALNKELGIQSSTEDLMTFEKGHNWQAFKDAVQNASALMSPIQYNGKTFLFEEGIHILRAAYHKGISNEYLKYLETFDILVEVIKDYEEWKAK